MSIFADPDAVADELLQSRMLASLQTYAPGVDIDPDYLAGKLLSSERDLQVALHIFFEPTEILPQSATQAEIDALAGAPYHQEPGYDVPLSFFRDGRWGYTLLRYAPVKAVHSVRFVYPTPGNAVLDVPSDWIRCDLKYGHLQLVPTGAASIGAAPFAIFGGALFGRGPVPQMMQVRYRSGINIADYPDILDLIKQKTMLSVIDDLFLPSSGSISADGLSESLSMDMNAHRERIDQRINKLHDTLKGVRCMVL